MGKQRDIQGMNKQFPGIFQRNSPQEQEDSCGIWEGILGKEREKLQFPVGNKQGKIPEIPGKNKSHQFKIPVQIAKGKTL